MSKARDTADWGQYQPQRKNLLINGAMNVWQRGIAFGAVSDIEYTADRWFSGVSTTGVASISISTNVPISATIGNSLKVDVTTADASVGASDFFYIAQRVEGTNILATGFGQAGAKALSLSFWAFSSKTGIHTGSIINAARDRSYTFEYTIDDTFTWQQIKIENIPGDTIGTWTFDTAQGFEVRFALMAGSNFVKTAGSWGTGDVIGTTNQVNILDNVSGDFRITEIQLEVGEEATDFEHRLFGDELSLCLRYFEKSFGQGITPAEGVAQASLPLGAALNSAAVFSSTVEFKVEKRSTVPTITYYRSANGAINGRWSYFDSIWNDPSTNPSVFDVNARGFGTQLGTAATTQGFGLLLEGHWTADAEL